MIDYAEEIFNSIKTIAQKELESLKFDSTIEATITDATRAEKGLYTVTNGSIYFTAYSTDPNYKEKEVVLVTVPQSDYSQQKVIIGKKDKGEEDKPLNYISPLSQIIDITNNLVQTEKSNQKIAQINKEWMEALGSLEENRQNTSNEEYYTELIRLNKYYQDQLLQNSKLEFGMIANSDNCVWESEDSQGFINEAYSISQTNNSSIGLIWSARDYGILAILEKYDKQEERNNIILEDYDKLINYNYRWKDKFNIVYNQSIPIDNDVISLFDDKENIKNILKKCQQNNNIIEQIDYDELISYNNKWKDNFTYSFKDDVDIEEMKNSLFKEEIGLTRIGIKADFQTFLKQYNTISGNYGLVLCVGFRNPDIEENDNTIKSTTIYPCVFDSDNFFGNIYNSINNNTQEAVFDISGHSNLILSDIFLFAYQKKNFKDLNKELIDEDIVPNIIIKNLYVCLGKEKSEFKNDLLELYSYSNPYYNNENNVNNNIKEISLRWIHKDKERNLIKSLTQNDFKDYEDTYEIRWYRYKVGARSPDKYMNMYWERFYGYSINNSNTIEILPGDQQHDHDYATDKFTVFLDPHLEEPLDKLYVLIIDKEQQFIVARSNVIEFENEQKINFSQFVKDINALSIKYNDNEEGNYFLYDSMHKLNEEDKGTRTLTAVFAEDTNNVHNKEELKPPFENIKWIFPANNTMITVLNPLDAENSTIASLFSSINQSLLSEGKYEDVNRGGWFSKEDNSIIYQQDNFYIKWDTNKQTYELQYIGDGSEEKNPYLSISYVINADLDFSKGRNTVILEVVKNKRLYIAQTSMLFGIFGASGSDYNLNIVWDSQTHIFGILDNDFDINPEESSEDKSLKLFGHVELYNVKKELIPVDKITGTYEYTWYNFKGTPLLKCEQYGDNKNDFCISYIDDYNNYKDSIFIMDQLYILEVKLVNFGNYELITRIPIPLANLTPNDAFKFKIDQIEGPTVLRYAADGTINFDKTPYQITFQEAYHNNTYDENLKDGYSGQWKIISMNENNAVGVPKLSYNTNEAFYKLIDYLKQKPLLLYFIIKHTTIQQDDNQNSNVLKSLTLNNFFVKDENNNINFKEINQSMISKFKNAINNFKKNIDDESNNDKDYYYDIDETEVVDLINNPDTINNNYSKEKEFYEILFKAQSSLVEQYKLLLNKENTAVQDEENNLFILLTILEALKNISFEEENVNKLTYFLTNYCWLNIQNHFSLLPFGVYVNNLDLYGIQFKYIDKGYDLTLFTQPIYAYQDNYISPTLNQWDGTLSLEGNNKAGAILAKAIAAGKKEDNNTFSGVIFGDWSDDNFETSQTGIYGFNEGAMSYAFREDGSAFIGSGTSKISFNENKNDSAANIVMDDGYNYISLAPGKLSIQGFVEKKNNLTNNTVIEKKDLLKISNNDYYLKSANYDDEDQTGTYINLQNGQIKGYNFSLNTASKKNTNVYELNISSVSPFLQITRKRLSKNIIVPTNKDLYTKFADNYQTFLNLIDEQYNTFLTLFDALQKIQTIDNGVLINETVNQKNIYAQLIVASSFDNDNEQFPLFDDLRHGIEAQTKLDNAYKNFYKRIYQISYNSENDSRTNEEKIQEIYLSNKNEFLNYIKNPNNGIPSDVNSYFGEISNLLLQQLNDDQKQNLISQLKPFLPEKIIIDDNNEGKPVEQFFNLNYVDNNKNQHLLYPKITQEKINSLKDSLYKNLMTPYNDALEKLEKWLPEGGSDAVDWTVKENSVEWNKLVDTINEEANKIIQLFNMSRVIKTKNFSQENYSYVYASKEDVNSSGEDPDDGQPIDTSSASTTAAKTAIFEDNTELIIDNNTEIAEDNNQIRMPYILFSSGYYKTDMPTEKIPTNFTGFIIKGGFYPVIRSQAKTLYNSQYVLKKIDDYTYESSVLFLNQPSAGSYYGRNYSVYIVEYVENGTIQLNSSGLFKIDYTSLNKPVVLTLITNRSKWNLREDKSRFVQSEQFPRSKSNNTMYGNTSYYLKARYVSEDEAYGLKKIDLYCNNIVQTYITALDSLNRHFTNIQRYYKSFFASQFEATIKAKMNENVYITKHGDYSIKIYEEPYIGIVPTKDDDIILNKSDDFYNKDGKILSYDYYYKRNNSNYERISWDETFDITDRDKISIDLFSYYNNPPEYDYAVELYKQNVIGKNINYYFPNIKTCLNKNNENPLSLNQCSYYNFTDIGLEAWERTNSLYLAQLLQKLIQQEGENPVSLFNILNWNNDLINITENGGYMTSKNYRPTMQSGAQDPIEPTAYQGTTSQYWYQGLKGFIIDFTNDKFVLGNNAKIEGYQTQFYPGQTDVFCRTFYISTGASFSTQNDQDKVFDKQFFIEAYEGYPGRLQKTFYVKWNGDVYIGGNLRVKGDITNF